jgi:hypothetical protein
MTAPWLPQPTDEPMNEYYREKFAKGSQAKQIRLFTKRERDLRWWQRYSPTKDDMPRHMTYPDMYNMMSKTLNFGDLSGAYRQLIKASFRCLRVDEFDPFAPVTFDDLETVTMAAPTRMAFWLTSRLDTLDGGEYANGVLIPPAGFPSSDQRRYVLSDINTLNSPRQTLRSVIGSPERSCCSGWRARHLAEARVDPGLYFEDTAGDIRKIGPLALRHNGTKLRPL